MSDELPPNPPCGGVATTPVDRYGRDGITQPPKCCEVHLLPWGHDRANLGMLQGVVRPDEPAGGEQCGAECPTPPAGITGPVTCELPQGHDGSHLGRNVGWPLAGGEQS